MVEMLVNRNGLAPAPEFNEVADRAQTDLADHPDTTHWNATGSRNAAFTNFLFGMVPQSTRSIHLIRKIRLIRFKAVDPITASRTIPPVNA